ncbi:MAG: aminodeoxychorismate synthase component I [Gemmatimonadota bacterium]
MSDPSAIIDFRSADEPGRLIFGEPRELFVAETPEDVTSALSAAENAALRGRWVVGFVAYEAAPAFDARFRVRTGCEVPLAWFAAYDQPERAAPLGRTPAFPPSGPAEIPAGWVTSEDRATHRVAVETIRELIAAGDVYQVNHTLRLRRAFAEDPLAFYETLASVAAAPCSAYVRLPAHHVLSVSPELFFRRTGDRITTRPMKGTAPRGRWTDEDDALGAALGASEKDRAENLMIVDLLRNDLGRVAEFGSVEVSDLFRVEAFPTVHQMTSTVSARCRPRTSLADVFAALFPCGSVTGAPKIAATEVIARLEDSPRQAYCGAIGLLRPGGDCAFSVAIRTALVDQRRGEISYGVGGGVTWASTARGEWQEALGKAAILGELAAADDLIETLRLEDGRPLRWARHKARMIRSAGVLGHAANPEALDAAVREACQATGAGSALIRVRMAHDGRASAAVRAFDPKVPLTAGLAADPICSTDPRLFHKTSDRTLYERARERLPDRGEVLLWNERGEITEFTRGNVVVELGGTLFTPPINAGLLPGVYRDELVRSGRVEERPVRVEDVAAASAIWFVNSAREWVPVGWNPRGAGGVAKTGGPAPGE